MLDFPYNNDCQLILDHKFAGESVYIILLNQSTNLHLRG